MDKKKRKEIKVNGIAKMIKIEILGDPSFFAPELLAGEGEKCSDIWSLGCIMLFMFTGESPFHGETLE